MEERKMEIDGIALSLWLLVVWLGFMLLIIFGATCATIVSHFIGALIGLSLYVLTIGVVAACRNH